MLSACNVITTPQENFNTAENLHKILYKEHLQIIEVLYALEKLILL